MDAEHSVVFANSRTPFKTTLSMKDLLHFYILIVVINMSVKHIVFSLRSEAMIMTKAEKKNFKYEKIRLFYYK